MKFLKTALLASTFVGLAVAVPVGATDLAGTATVTIVEGIAITQNFDLRFGNIQKPTDADTTFTVNPDNTTSGPAGGNGIFVGPAASRGPGQYDVAGTDAATYTFSVTGGGACGTGVSLGTLTHDAAATLDDLDVHVGGTLTVSTGATDGLHSCSFTVSAIYS